MCGRGRLFPDTEQPPQNAPHAAGRTPHHDLHALTSCHASTPRRRRSAETPPETSGTPPETRRRSGCPVPAPARRSPETSFRRHIVARYIPPLLQYMKERTRRAWRGGTSRTPSSTGAQQNNAAPRKGRRAFSVHVWHRRRRVIFAAFTSGNRERTIYLWMIVPPTSVIVPPPATVTLVSVTSTMPPFA